MRPRNRTDLGTFPISIAIHLVWAFVRVWDDNFDYFINTGFTLVNNGSRSKP